MSNYLDIFMTKTTQEGMSTIDKLSGVEFENFCVEMLIAEGFTNIQTTKASGDNGVDITASKLGVSYAVQCKRYSSSVGNNAIQQVFSGKAIYHKDKDTFLGAKNDCETFGH